MTKAIFLVGAPGSGKDLLIRSVLGEHTLVEISLDKLSNAINNHQDLPEVDSNSSLIVNGNADRLTSITQARAVLEAMGYETAMLYVYTTNEASKARNDIRIARKAKTFTESQRQEKYSESVKCLESYSTTFKSFWLFNNSADVRSINEEVTNWLIELSEQIDTWLGESQTNKDYVKHMSGPRTLPTAPAPATPHASNIKGFERVNINGRWTLRRKPSTSESTKYNTSLNRAFETYTATAVDNSRGNTRVTDNGSPTENPATVMAKVLKPSKKTPSDTDKGGIAMSSKNMAEPPTVEATSVDQKVKAPAQKRGDKKNTKTKGAMPPPDFFDSKMGGVPSGSLGITSEYKPSGTPLSELRKRMRK